MSSTSVVDSDMTNGGGGKTFYDYRYPIPIVSNVEVFLSTTKAANKWNTNTAKLFWVCPQRI